MRVGGCLNEVSLGHYEPVCARSGFHTFFSTRVLGAPTGSTGTRLPVHTTSVFMLNKNCLAPTEQCTRGFYKVDLIFITIIMKNYY